MQMFMFEAVITNVSEWRSILAAIGNIVEDAMFICNADEVTFRGMDAAHVALLDVSFPKRSFESLKADASMFGIKIEDFKNVLAAASADDKVTLSIEGKDKLSITFSGSLDMKYNLKLLEGREGDVAEIVAGTFKGRTTGAPIAVLIWNKDKDSNSYKNLEEILRPGHADYPAMVKYSKYNDHRGGGRFSGRLTATHVMGGAIARKLLAQALKIKTTSFVTQIGKIKMPESKSEPTQQKIYSTDTRCPHAKTSSMMKNSILNARKNGDSLGGVIKSITSGVPVGVGEPVFDSIESDLAKAIYSIPSVKGVEFGSGFAGAATRGSENNDIYKIDSRKKITTDTNNSGGILGGLSIGMPIVMNVAFKPVSSISMRQKSVNIRTKKISNLQVKGRHDPCVVPRAPPVVDALVSLAIADLAIQGGFIPQVISNHGRD